jgi:glycosyltransferase involved in cell wall biosynthesis
VTLRLTAALIVRDEELTLPDCLASLRGVADEVVIVDTGSSDRTVEIATAHGARVLHHPWEEDFSKARNVGLDQARGRWILCIDADERLRPVDRADLRALLDDAEEIAFLVHLHQVAGFTATLDYRLWRNDPRIRFRNAMHEKVVYAVQEAAAADGRPIGVCDLTLDHVGYAGDQTRKHQRNLALLRAQLAVEPDNIFDWRHLAHVLFALGEPEEAERALEHAVRLARHDWNEHGGAAWADLACLRYERGDDVTELLAEGRARWPRNWALVWTEGQIDLHKGRFEAALACFRRLLQVDTASIPLDGVGYDERLFGSAAHAAIGAALFRSGRYTEAADAYAAAQELEPDDAELAAKRRVAESRAAMTRHVQS